MVSLLFTGTCVTNASETKNYDFSTFTEDDALNYVKEQGIIMPEGFEDIADYKAIILGIIQEAYNDESYLPAYSYTEMYRFASEIAVSVRENTDYSNRASQINAKASTYVLQYSTQHGQWKDAYLNYNCYGYAIGRTIFQNPGYYSGNTFTMSNVSISEIASYVKQDLVALGYVVNVSTTCPSSLSQGQNLICVRKGADDYHFMKYSGGSWYHKPSSTNPLKYNYSSAGATIWNNERIINGVTYAPNTSYNSTIYYITYWTTSGSGVGTASIIEP